MLEVGVGHPVVRCCIPVRDGMGGVTVRREMQGGFYGFSSAAAQHDGCDGKQDDDKPFRHRSGSLRQLAWGVKVQPPGTVAC